GSAAHRDAAAHAGAAVGPGPSRAAHCLIVAEGGAAQGRRGALLDVDAAAHAGATRRAAAASAAQGGVVRERGVGDGRGHRAEEFNATARGGAPGPAAAAGAADDLVADDDAVADGRRGGKTRRLRAESHAATVARGEEIGWGTRCQRSADSPIVPDGGIQNGRVPLTLNAAALPEAEGGNAVAAGATEGCVPGKRAVRDGQAHVASDDPDFDAAAERSSARTAADGLIVAEDAVAERHGALSGPIWDG